MQRMLRLDHLVLGAHTLAQGVDYVEQQLGVTVPPGGQHKMFGTHNCVMQLGSQCYFEIIAIDPAAESPSHTRWYGLDDPEQAAALQREPALIAWVAAVDDLRSVQPSVDWIDGDIQTLTRGEMHWQMLLPANGQLKHRFCPWLIHWPPGQRPHERLPDPGCRFQSLTVTVPDPDRYRALFGDLELPPELDITAGDNHDPTLRATILGMNGPVTWLGYS